MSEPTEFPPVAPERVKALLEEAAQGTVLFCICDHGCAECRQAAATLRRVASEYEGMRAEIARLTAERDGLSQRVQALERFDCGTGGCGDDECCGTYGVMERASSGDWVRYADVLSTLPSSPPKGLDE